MHTERIQLLGAGGHTAVVVDALLASGQPADQIDVWTQGQIEAGQNVLGIAVRHLLVLAALAGLPFHICIGDNRTRGRLYAELSALDARPFSIVHPAATVSPYATIGSGTLVAARAIIAPRAAVGKGGIINHGAVVDHDCHVGDFAHIAPGATLGGAVQVGDLALIGAGANILPSRRVGRGGTIGAGSVVVQDTQENVVYAGVPAAPFGQRII
ncbi:NeuD/PglB/VioB family sugar acetyltransferase [Devosia sp. XGJD_8]|uniref:NeuD/PglB/VioB family sugar acetyltransferase n=1 Tax=Devosia sp. XGJD_8 TaxID=3391187 RepID=UPI00398568B8